MEEASPQTAAQVEAEVHEMVEVGTFSALVRAQQRPCICPLWKGHAHRALLENSR